MAGSRNYTSSISKFPEAPIDGLTYGRKNASWVVTAGLISWLNSVKDFFDPTSALPVGPSTGDRYIASATANGWTTNYIYEYNGTIWNETIVGDGDATMVTDPDPNVAYIFDGSSWVNFGEAISHASLINLNWAAAGHTIDTDIAMNNYSLTDVGHLDFNLVEATIAQEGRLSWDAEVGTLVLGLPGGNVNLQIGEEMYLPNRPKNVEGSQINNGSAVILSGATGAVPEVELINSSEINSNFTIAMATENITDQQRGYYTKFGSVRDFNTSNLVAGKKFYLDNTDQTYTSVKPLFPNYPVKMGFCIRSHPTEGVAVADIDSSRGEDLANLVNGSFRESFDAVVDSSDGVTITMSLERTGGGDLTMQFSDGFEVLDCTPAATIVLTAGTTNIPQENYIYILKSTKVLTKSTTGWPSAEHIKVGYFFVQSASDVQADGGSLINQNWNDHLADTDLMGHLLHMAQNLRRRGAIYVSGFDGEGGDDYTTSTAGTVTGQIGAGVISQLHEQSIAAKDTAVSDDFHIVNAHSTDGGAYFETQNLYDVTVDSQGNTLNNKFFNVVMFIVGNKGGQYAPIMINVPDGSYNNLSDAEADVDGYDVLTIPREFNIESSTSVLICRMTFRKTGGTWVYQSTVDLRGSTSGVATGGTPGGITTTFSDALFEWFNNLDSTKRVSVDLSGITTGNTRTIAMADANMTMFTTTQYTDLTDAGDSTLHYHATDRALANATGTLAIANGGTGQTSQTNAFDALAPTTTKGDLTVHNGTDNIRLPVGTNTHVLTSDSTQASGVKWAAAGSGSTTFLALTDTPANYTNQVGALPMVNGAEDALEFVFDGDLTLYSDNFESGNFTAGGWSTVNDGTNDWIVASTDAISGTYSAYISDDGTNNDYTITTAQVSHLYVDVAIPANAKKLRVKFDWRCEGEATFDYGTLWMTDTTVTPVAGTVPTAGATIRQIGATRYEEQSTTQNEDFYISAADLSTVAGTTQRFLFTWENDTLVGTDPPFNIDNVEIIAEMTTKDNLINSTFRAERITSNQTASSGIETTVICNSEDFDNDSEYSTTTGIFTAKNAGIYQFNVSASLSLAAAGKSEARIYQNSTLKACGGDRTNQAETVGPNTSVTLKLAANDTVTFKIFQNSGSTGTILSSGCTQFSGVRIGDV